MRNVHVGFDLQFEVEFKRFVVKEDDVKLNLVILFVEVEGNTRWKE
jgi:hypothetical protein